MRNLVFTLVGVFFGIVLYKGEVISWFRIQEMFRFQSFHMYGVIGAAIAVGALSTWLIKRTTGPNSISPKPMTKGTVVGGLMFGMGWALTGACPGPLYALVGSGVSVMLVTIAAALVGAWTYAMIRPKLPH